MQDDLHTRVMAAQAAADADREPRCHWCAAPASAAVLTEVIYSHVGRVVECENASACHVRFESTTNREGT